MNLKQLSVLLVFGITASAAYGAALGDGAMLDDLNGNQNNLVYGSAHNNTPGANAILGIPSSNSSEVTNLGSGIATSSAGAPLILGTNTNPAIATTASPLGNGAVSANQFSVVPEPSAIALLCLGLLGWGTLKLRPGQSG